MFIFIFVVVLVVVKSYSKSKNKLRLKTQTTIIFEKSLNALSNDLNHSNPHVLFIIKKKNNKKLIYIFNYFGLSLSLFYSHIQITSCKTKFLLFKHDT